MKILLINTPSGNNLKIYPIGLDYLASTLIASNHSVESLDLDLCSAALYKKRLREALSVKPYDIVGFNLRNLCDQTSDGNLYLPLLKELIKQTRTAAVGAPLIVIGGAGASLSPELIRREAAADTIIAGDGEAGFGELIQRVAAGEEVRGTIIRARNILDKIIYTRGSWGYLEQYLKLDAYGNLQSKRGCDQACSYCAYPLIEGKSLRLREPQIVAGEFLQLERLGFKKIFMVDAVFNNPLPQAKAVLHALIGAGTTAEWTGFFCPKYIDRELLELVKESNGGHPLKITIDSGSPTILKTLDKGFSQEDILAAVSLCRAAGIPFSITALFGGPGENSATIAETCKLIAELRPEYVSASIGIYLYPQTGLAAATRGTLWNEESELLGKTSYPVDRESVKKQIEHLLAGSSFPVYIH